ncbi:MAG: ATP-binding protein [Rubripirellula sp.]|nr:ATP-binding protein [Rubripirellula sp.]
MNQVINHYALTTPEHREAPSVTRFTHANGTPTDLDSESFRLHNARNVITHLQAMIHDTIEKHSRVSTEPILQIASLLTDTPSNDIHPQSIGSHLVGLSESLERDHKSLTTSLLALHQTIHELSTVVSTSNLSDQIHETSQFSIGAFLREIATQCEQNLNRQEITFSIESDRGGTIASRRNLLHQVMLNLIANSEEAFCDHPRPNKQISIQHRSIDGWHRIQITDNGCGIPKSVQTKILDLGYTTRDDGKGLGLCFCVEAMQQLHGYLEINSDGAHQGTTVTLHLPFS